MFDLIIIKLIQIRRDLREEYLLALINYMEICGVMEGI